LVTGKGLTTRHIKSFQIVLINAQGESISPTEMQITSSTDWKSLSGSVLKTAIPEKIELAFKEVANVAKIKLTVKTSDYYRRFTLNEIILNGYPETRPHSFDCWYSCGEKGGACSACGAGGACCRKGWSADPSECAGMGCNGQHCCSYSTGGGVTSSAIAGYSDRLGDCPGNDIWSIFISGVTLEECARRCTTHPDCVAFMFFDGKRCYPKTKTCQETTKSNPANVFYDKLKTSDVSNYQSDEPVHEDQPWEEVMEDDSDSWEVDEEEDLPSDNDEYQLESDFEEMEDDNNSWEDEEEEDHPSDKDEYQLESDFVHQLNDLPEHLDAPSIRNDEQLDETDEE